MLTMPVVSEWLQGFNFGLLFLCFIMLTWYWFRKATPSTEAWWFATWLAVTMLGSMVARFSAWTWWAEREDTPNNWVSTLVDPSFHLPLTIISNLIIITGVFMMLRTLTKAYWGTWAWMALIVVPFAFATLGLL